ncbi:MAG: argininosuccinate lyase [Geodermatophilaceae bacterium]|nr:argininosuccinate lyase [Geodermatophilaceae bacterium]
MTTGPEGYLGTHGRITKGPAPELLEAGYRLEIADAPLLHRGLALADLAHQVSLVEAGAVDPDVVRPLLRRLLDLVDSDPADFPYDPVYGDAYNARERDLEKTLGPVAGWMHLGRTRREAGRIAFRLALRDLLLDLHADVAELTMALAAGTEAHAGAIWADSTYLQPAQPSTFGHYLGQFGEQALRHLERIEAAYRTADICPGGAGGAGGSRIALDRQRLADLLGFTQVGANTRDAMWSVDGPLDAVFAAVQAVLTADQIAEDLEIFASPAFDYVELDASMCRASVLMPQKRNPYALAVIRGGAGTLAGRLAGLVTTARTPSARTDNWLYTYGEVAGSLDLAGRLIRLTTALLGGLRVNTDVLAAGARANYIGAADLAEDLSVRHGLDYRTSYRIVGRAVAVAVAGGLERLTVQTLAAAAIEVTGDPLQVSEDVLPGVENPVALVEARAAPGSAKPQRVREHAGLLRQRVEVAARWREGRRAAVAAADADLQATARSLAGTYAGDPVQPPDSPGPN